MYSLMVHRFVSGTAQPLVASINSFLGLGRRPSSYPPAHLDQGLALLLYRVLYQVFIKQALTSRESRDYRATTIHELAQTLTSSDLSADLNTVVVHNAAHEHGSDRNDSDRCASSRTLDDHHAPFVLTENVESAGLT